VFTEVFDVDPERVCKLVGDLEIDGVFDKTDVFDPVIVNVRTPDLLIVDEGEDVLEYIPLWVEYTEAVGKGDRLSLTVDDGLDDNESDEDELIELDTEFVCVYVCTSDSVVKGVGVSIPV
jgi:hypothetical protein